MNSSGQRIQQQQQEQTNNTHTHAVENVWQTRSEWKKKKWCENAIHRHDTNTNKRKRSLYFIPTEMYYSKEQNRVGADRCYRFCWLRSSSLSQHSPHGPLLLVFFFTNYLWLSKKKCRAQKRKQAKWKRKKNNNAVQKKVTNSPQASTRDTPKTHRHKHIYSISLLAFLSFIRTHFLRHSRSHSECALNIFLQNVERKRSKRIRKAKSRYVFTLENVRWKWFSCCFTVFFSSPKHIRSLALHNEHIYM